jgi:phthiocerol/phenolphthiocerol synthesis type-I polyketide synthase E
VTGQEQDGTAVDGDIALIGMACRFPRADSPEEFWQLLVDGVEAIDTLATDELVRAGIDLALIANPHYVRKTSRLADIAGFDAEFFGIPPREAEIMDPQHRLFLECAWEALERAGHPPDPPGQAVGVFAGCGMPGYFIANLAARGDLMQSAGAFALMLANDKDFLATRVAYKLGFTGPAYTVQTACSTGLVAVHLACQSLLAGECGMAIAGAVSLRVPQNSGYLHQPGMILSPDGHCRPFDADAQGTIGGSGVGIVVLRPLADARRDGDPVLAVIKATAVNNDGNDKVGYTAPSVSGQAAVIADALAVAGVPAAEIGYIEAHGTATPLGDPIELRALARVFSAAGGARRLLGSVKSNVGHLDTAAGIAGLIKATLAIHHGVIPPSLHFKRPNPEAGEAASLFRVPTIAETWPPGSTRRRAGVSSFGIGGTNAHAVLEEAPAPASVRSADPPYLLTLSARGIAPLADAATRLADHLERHPEIELADVAHTLAVGRAAFRHRRFVVCRDAPEAVRALRAPVPARESQNASVAFMFPGQGSQRSGMAARLYAWAPVFREEIDRCAAILQPDLPNLRDLLLSPDACDINQTAFAQPALFVMCWALAQQWIDWGVRPTCMLGHSLGELVSAAVGAVVSLPDALHLVALRGRLMQAARPGAMLAVALGEAELSPLLPAALSLAAVNGPRACVVGGPVACIEDFADRLAKDGVAVARLATSHAFHSAAMDEALAGFGAYLRTLKLAPPTIPFVSNVSGNWVAADEATSADYWVSQARQPVRFFDGLSTLLAEDGMALLEVGPGQILSGLARSHPRRAASVAVASATARRLSEDDASASLDALGTLWTAGVIPRWPAVIPGPRRRVTLPTYCFQHCRFWIEPPAAGSGIASRLPIDDRPQRDPDVTRDPGGWFRAISWRRLPPLPPAAPPSPLLVFADDSPLSKAVLALATDAIVVRAAANGVHEPGTIGIDPADQRHWRRLVADLVASGRAPATILYLWSLAGDEESCFHRLVALASALESEGQRHPASILAVTFGAQDVLGGEVTCPSAALVTGPARVIRSEMPFITSRCVDIAEPLPQAAPLLLAEAAAHNGDVVVGHRGAYRWAPAAEPADLAPQELPPLRERGVYLIAGGLGGIGLSLADDLARYCRARLVLTGRSGLPPRDSWSEVAGEDSALARRLQRVMAVEQNGGEVLAVAADLTDPTSMRDVFALAEARFGALNGVIHAAGVPGGAMIARTDRDTAQRTLAAKVEGMRILAPLLSARRLDFVALCSSTAGLLGEPGQVAYCAANAALDAWAHHLRRQGVPAVSIDWATWREVGMAVETSVPEDLKAWRARTLAEGITPSEGAEAFRRVLAAELHQVVIVPQAATPLAADIGAGVDPSPVASPMAAGRVPRPAMPHPYTPPANDTQRALAALWEELLGVAPIGIDDDFFALGGHSLLATRILAAVWRDFSVEMSLAGFFEYPTIAQLADKIVLDQIAGYDPEAVQAALAALEGED